MKVGDPLQKSIMIGMSGGVDSTVAAAILKEQGYKVIGVTLKLWDDDKQSEYSKTCCSLEDIDDARNAAYELGIPYYVLNMKELFLEEVVNSFVIPILRLTQSCILIKIS